MNRIENLQDVPFFVALFGTALALSEVRHIAAGLEDPSAVDELGELCWRPDQHSDVGLGSILSKKSDCRIRDALIHSCDGGGSLR